MNKKKTLELHLVITEVLAFIHSVNSLQILPGYKGKESVVPWFDVKAAHVGSEKSKAGLCYREAKMLGTGLQTGFQRKLGSLII